MPTEQKQIVRSLKKNHMTPSEQEANQIEKINQAASVAANVVADAASQAKAVISQAAAGAMSTLTTAAAVQSRDIEFIKEGMNKLNDKFDKVDLKYVSVDVFKPYALAIDELEKNVVRKDDFVFWRNLLVSGMLLTIFLAALANIFNK